MVDVGEALAEADALLADERSDLRDPAAVGAVVSGPKARAIDRSSSVENLRELRRQTCIAGLLFCAREFVAIFKIANLVFEENEFGAEEQVLVGVVRGVVSDGFVPDVLFGDG